MPSGPSVGVSPVTEASSTLHDRQGVLEDLPRFSGQPLREECSRTEGGVLPARLVPRLTGSDALLPVEAAVTRRAVGALQRLTQHVGLAAVAALAEVALGELDQLQRLALSHRRLPGARRA